MLVWLHCHTLQTSFFEASSCRNDNQRDTETVMRHSECLVNNLFIPFCLGKQVYLILQSRYILKTVAPKCFGFCLRACEVVRVDL